MDLAWCAVLTFLVQGRSHSLRGAIDSDEGRVCIQDDELPEAPHRLRMWARLLRESGGEASLLLPAAAASSDRHQAVAAALAARDGAALRQHVRATLHHCCSRIRIVSQDSTSARSVHLVWYSVIHCANQMPVITYGPRASFPQGTTMLITVPREVVPWLPHTFVHLPVVIRDDALFDSECRQLRSAVHSLMTPLKQVGDSADALDATRGRTVAPVTPMHVEDYVECEICLGTVPLAMMIFVEACGHSVCLSCAMACAQKHVDAPNSTPGNMPCPAAGCSAALHSFEVRALLPAAAMTDLEYNEVRLALRENCAVCPSCSCTFERYLDAGSGASDDPLRERLVCGACGASFCVRCGVHPFHEGRPCREGGAGAAPRCRYCGNDAVSFNPDVCDSATCTEKGRRACVHGKSCGHVCHGTLGERHCVGCLDDTCEHRHPQHSRDDFCAICYTDALGDAPCLELACGHVFHTHCLERKLAKRWPTARISFAFMDCPLCGVEIHHHLLSKEVAELHRIREKLEARYIDRLRIEGLLESVELTDPASRYFGKPLEFARDNLNFYMCSRCAKPYFGGLRRCQDVEQEPLNRDELVCGACSAGSAKCEVHGTAYMEHKCKYCCNTAVWFCWGTTHFCELCHSPPRRTVREECPGEERCPLAGRHPPNGTEFAIGCAMCRSEAAAAAAAAATAQV